MDASRMNIAKELLRLAESLIASGDDLDGFWQAYSSGTWPHMAFFKGKKRPTNNPTRLGEGTGLRKDNLESVAVSDLSWSKKRTDKGEMLILTFTGSAGRTDTYVMTRVPYLEMSDKVRAPKRKVVEIAAEVKTKLRDLGLYALGNRSGKGGEMYGIKGNAREVAVGRNDIMLNVFQVYISDEDAVRRPDTSWRMKESVLISKVKDRQLEAMAKWVKGGPTMKEVRDDARDAWVEDASDGFVIKTGSEGMDSDFVFEAMYAERVGNAIKAGIFAPFVNAKPSKFVSRGRASVAIFMSLDPKDEWVNGIYQNSRYATLMVNNDGTIETAASGLGMKHMRKTRFRTVVDAIGKINKYLRKMERVASSRQLP